MSPSLRHTWQRSRHLLAHRRTQVVAVWLIGLAALYALLGFFALPYFAKPHIEQALADALQRPVEIGSLYTNPFSFSARVDALRVYAPDMSDTVAGIDELYANVSITSVFRLAPVLDRVRVTRPYLKVVRHEDRQYNFQDVIDRYVWQEEKPEDKKPALYSLNNIEVIDGRIEFDDRLEKRKHEIRDLRLGIPFLSSLPYETDIVVQPQLSAVVNGAPLAIRGQTKPFGATRESTLYIDFDRFELPQYFNYVPIPLRFELASGALDARLILRIVSDQGQLQTLSVVGTAALNNLQLQQRDGEPLIALESLAVDVRELDLVNRRLAATSVRAKAPRVHVTRFRGGNLNLELLMPLDTAKPAAATAEADAAPPFSFAIDELDIGDGRVELVDYAAPKTFKSTLTEIALHAGQLSNHNGQSGKFDAALRFNGQGSLKTEGELALAPVKSTGRLQIADLQLKQFQPYLGPERELVGGTLSGAAQYDVALGGATPDIRISALDATVRDSRIDTAIGKDRWHAGSIAVSGARIDLQKRDVVVEQASGKNVAATVLRERDGAWHITGLLHILAEQAEKAEAGDAPAKPWTYLVKKIGVEQSSLIYEDRATPKPVTLHATNLNAQLDNLSSADEAQPQLSLSAMIGKNGQLSLSGPLKLAPFGATWDVRAKAIPIAPFEPYWSGALNVDVTRGVVSIRGQLRLGESKSESGVRYSGNIAVTDFAARDGATSRDLLRWKRLFISKGVIHTQPVLLRAGAVSLSDFYTRVVVRPSGKLNLQELAGGSGETAAPATAEATESAPTASTVTEPAPPTATAPVETAAATPQTKPRIEIGDISLRNGQLSFSDFFIKPNYSAEVATLTGTITAMSPEQAGRIALSGAINETAPVTISGDINPLAAKLFLDINANAKEVNLPPLSPYSVRYIGYPIERGKLSMDVHYHIENDELTAQNELILNQLDFGEKVDSPEALNVPVHLAVSLLKDREGVINLNVPISGSLNDPQFSIGGVIMRVIGNLFIKAVTSPFAALGAIFGGSSEALSYIEFEPGSARLDDDDIGKLTKLAEALRDRPALKLDIAGRVDPEKERDALQRASLLRRLKAEKLKELAEAGGEMPSLDQVEIAPEEYDKYLERAYDAAEFDKPRNFIGFAKRLPREEMEKLLIDHIRISENAMRRLANNRAEAALEWLKDKGQVPVERIYVIAPRLNAEGIDDKGASTRADFALR